jgi:hypothetical protein
VSTVRKRNRGSAAPLLAVTLPILLAGLLAGAPTASAASVKCRGAITPQEVTAPAPAKASKAGKTPVGRDFEYTFFCSEEIKGFAIVASVEIDEFSTTADVLDPGSKQPVPDETFVCEGSIPSEGFGCAGKALTPNLITGKLSTSEKICAAGKSLVTVWLVATDAAGKPSEPYRLTTPKCPKPPRRPSNSK